jgi:hypothetical protein
MTRRAKNGVLLQDVCYNYLKSKKPTASLHMGNLFAPEPHGFPHFLGKAEP